MSDDIWYKQLLFLFQQLSRHKVEVYGFKLEGSDAFHTNTLWLILDKVWLSDSRTDPGQAKLCGVQ